MQRYLRTIDPAYVPEQERRTYDALVKGVQELIDRTGFGNNSGGFSEIIDLFKSVRDMFSSFITRTGSREPLPDRDGRDRISTFEQMKKFVERFHNQNIDIFLQYGGTKLRYRAGMTTLGSVQTFRELRYHYLWLKLWNDHLKDSETNIVQLDQHNAEARELLNLGRPVPGVILGKTER